MMSQLSALCITSLPGVVIVMMSDMIGVMFYILAPDDFTSLMCPILVCSSGVMNLPSGSLVHALTTTKLGCSGAKRRISSPRHCS